MPLKYAAETLLLCLLAVVIIATGIFLSLLPDLPFGMLSWVTVFILTTVYVLAFYPLFMEQRADLFLRFLHWVPSGMLLLWFCLQLLKRSMPKLGIVSRVYTFGSAYLAVTASLAILAYYCWRVLRQRGARLTVLALLFVPYTVFAFLQQGGVHLGDSLTAMLTRPGENEVAQDAVDVRPPQKFPQQPLTAFGTKLTDAVLRQTDTFAVKPIRPVIPVQPGTSRGTQTGLQPAAVPPARSVVQSGASSSLPTRLPQSGLSLTFMVMLLAGGYCTALHHRSLKRLALASS